MNVTDLVIPDDGFVDFVQHMMYNSQKSQGGCVPGVQLQNAFVRLLCFVQTAVTNTVEPCSKPKPTAGNNGKRTRVCGNRCRG